MRLNRVHDVGKNRHDAVALLARGQWPGGFRLVSCTTSRFPEVHRAIQVLGGFCGELDGVGSEVSTAAYEERPVGRRGSHACNGRESLPRLIIDWEDYGSRIGCIEL